MVVKVLVGIHLAFVYFGIGLLVNWLSTYLHGKDEEWQEMTVLLWPLALVWMILYAIVSGVSVCAEVTAAAALEQHKKREQKKEQKQNLTVTFASQFAQPNMGIAPCGQTIEKRNHWECPYYTMGRMTWLCFNKLPECHGHWDEEGRFVCDSAPIYGAKKEK